MNFLYDPMFYIGFIAISIGITMIAYHYRIQRKYSIPLGNDNWIPIVAYSVGQGTYQKAYNNQSIGINHRSRKNMIFRNMTVQYVVDGKAYNKKIPYRYDREVDIYYNKSNPKKIYLATEVRVDKFRNDTNYFLIGMISSIIGLVLILFSMFSAIIFKI